MSRTKPNSDQSELLGAALLYCAVADWFEAQLCAWHRRMSVDPAMEIFNQAETEFRAVGVKALCVSTGIGT